MGETIKIGPSAIPILEEASRRLRAEDARIHREMQDREIARLRKYAPERVAELERRHGMVKQPSLPGMPEPPEPMEIRIEGIPELVKVELTADPDKPHRAHFEITDNKRTFKTVLPIRLDKKAVEGIFGAAELQFREEHDGRGTGDDEGEPFASPEGSES